MQERNIINGTTTAVYRRPLTLYLWTIWIKFLVGNNGVLLPFQRLARYLLCNTNKGFCC